MAFNTYLENFINIEDEPKDKRLSFGNKAEDYIYNDLIKNGIEVELLKQRPNWSRQFDLEYGDLFFPKTNKYVDVKIGRGISKKCFDFFKGDGFLFCVGLPPKGANMDVDKIWYVTMSSLRLIKDSISNASPAPHHLQGKEATKGKDGSLVVLSKMPSGELGYYFNFSRMTNKLKYRDMVLKSKTT
jgi:hypothetical protein